jgi:ribosome maturation factor RimP
MIDSNRIRNLCEEALEPFNGFIIDVNVDEHNNIEVLADTDSGITIEEIKKISRHIESQLDREKSDFKLTVGSPGLSRPLTVFRQYEKNQGREVKVVTKSGEKHEGEMTIVDNNTIELKWKTREPKPVGKGKVTVEKNIRIALEDIAETKIKISI